MVMNLTNLPVIESHYVIHLIAGFFMQLFLSSLVDWEDMFLPLVDIKAPGSCIFNDLVTPCC